MAHKLFSHKLSVPPFVPGIVPGTNRVKSGFHCVKEGENPGLSQVFTGFVPGTNPVKSPDKPGVVPRPTGQKSFMFMCLSGRIKHAPNCGYRFVSPLPPFSRRGICRFPVPENALFLWEILLFLQNLLYESTVFPHREIGGKRWREMVDLNSVHPVNPYPLN